MRGGRYGGSTTPPAVLRVGTTTVPPGGGARALGGPNEWAERVRAPRVAQPDSSAPARDRHGGCPGLTGFLSAPVVDDQPGRLPTPSGHAAVDGTHLSCHAVS
ncbi:hypothetical protein ABZ341_26105, partial [Streptomyces sp. NPDC006173]|uniref:hypothetical protein n=1 Tax=Streptomyces sp. NPDC006173 TaxID=3155349 RepID=UPI0033D49A85